MRIMDPTQEKGKGRCRGAGSALILTVVLTSLLAVVGVLFLMAARIDKMATSATTDNRQLGFAVDSVVSQISEALAKDLPGFSPPQEYYDYPDPCNAWLADLEPYGVAVESTTRPNQYDYDCYWRQISNLTGGSIGATQRVRALPVAEREPIDLSQTGANADADGDGVSDAKWFAVPGLTSSKGKPIYAAVRIVDNGGMLNVNTGYRFDPNTFAADGRSQLQVNVTALGVAPGDSVAVQSNKALALLAARATGPANAADLAAYERDVIWRYEYNGQDPELSKKYRPFGLSDELELRYRYQLDHDQIHTRVEDWGRFDSNTVPVEYNGSQMTNWYMQATGAGRPESGVATFDPNNDKFTYDYRHIATAHNLDQIRMPRYVHTGEEWQDPNVTKMVNVNDMVPVTEMTKYTLTQTVEKALAGTNLVDIADPAQIVANILDYIDDDKDSDDGNDITVTWGTHSTSEFYGFERPCIYLSELAYRFVYDDALKVTHRSYAVELCKPYPDHNDPTPRRWRVVINNPGSNDPNQVISRWSGNKQFHLLLSLSPDAPLAEYDPNDPNQSSEVLDSAGFRDGATIELQRTAVVSRRPKWLTVDRIVLDGEHKGFVHEPNSSNTDVHAVLQRDISPEKCILRLWGPPSTPGKSLGNGRGHYVDTDAHKVQACPANQPLVNIGELGKIFAWNAYILRMPEMTAPRAEDLLINLAEPAYQNLFNYLTVIDPVAHNSDLREQEMRIKGRININTAPPFVLAQLPWMRYRDVGFQRALKVVEYRDTHGAFKSTAGLLQVPEMTNLFTDEVNNYDADTPSAGHTVFKAPDLTQDDVVDDLEERDLIFTRISDLVTVRSDVFTAYILVRIGLDGPQKRVVAILDRGLTKSPTDVVRVLSLEPVPDMR
ncbi:MAG: hypothetical protein JW955_00860 [Sedimentisphaerales bacterium]|nr:hypothetical protein [Sedimentisphaerales bacterium]